MGHQLLRLVGRQGKSRNGVTRQAIGGLQRYRRRADSRIRLRSPVPLVGVKVKHATRSGRGTVG